MKKSLITSRQLSQAGNFVADISRKVAENTFREISENGQANSFDMQRFLASGKRIKSVLTEVLKKQIEEIAMGKVGCLKLISTGKKVVIKATSGKRTIAGAGKTFPGYIDSDYENYGCNVTAEAKPDTPTDVYEMEENGTFAQIFGGFGENLDRLCLTQDQIIEFVESNPEWLRTDGYATFFLFKVKNEFFVAGVHFRSGGRLRARVDRFSGVGIVHAGCLRRVVVPQLMTIKNQS